MISVQKTFHAESGAQTQARQEMPFCNEKMMGRPFISQFKINL